MKNRKKMVTILICIIFTFIIGSNPRNEKCELEIDAVSSVSVDDHEKLLVVAKCNRIEDKTKFAKNILQKYIDNSFQSIRLSTDLQGGITCLQVSVYMKEKQIKEGNPIMEIEYKLRRVSLGDDIRETPELVDIFIDGKKIDT